MKMELKSKDDRLDEGGGVVGEKQQQRIDLMMTMEIQGERVGCLGRFESDALEGYQMRTKET
jgi:hypothetical protein